MWKLAIEDDQGNRTVVNLVRDEYSIGRAEENTVRLTERNISRRHAKLVKASGGWMLSDASSDNGCFLNGVRVGASQKIEHGDLLQLGDYRLEMIDETARPLVSGSPVATIPVLPKSQSLVGQPDRLVMLVGPAPGAEFPLVGSRLVVGRGEECDLPLNHSSVSRVHAEIHAVSDGRYEILDRDSANGVRVNGVELKRSLIDARDTIELGDVVLKFIPAGEIFRPGVDDTQHISATGHRAERPSPAPGVEAHSSKSSVSSGIKVVAALAGLSALVLLGMLTLRSSRVPSLTPEEQTVASADVSSKTLAEAKALLDQGDVEGAHRKATTEIAEDSSARKAPEFREIEARWADEKFAAVAAEVDTAKKRALLEQLTKASSLEASHRARAMNELAALDIVRVDLSDLPATPPSASVAAKEPAPKPARPKAAAGRAPAPEASVVTRDNPYEVYDAQDPAPPASSKTPNPEDLATSGDRQKIARAKAILQNKANSGKATEQELRMLKALCRQLADPTCSQ